jgi:CRP-like cAMP-binding protein
MSDNANSFAPSTVIFREGDPAAKLWIVKRGEVLCLKYSKERLIPVFVAKAQDIIGESAMLKDAPYTYSAISTSEVELIPINNDDFNQIMGVAPKWLADLTTTMVSRFQHTSELVAENRVLHPSIVSEEDFPPSLEIQYKKLLNQ